MCIDINECDRGTHNCDLTVGICQNLVGTFVCNCPISHYLLLSNTTGTNECILINCKPGFTNLGNVFISRRDSMFSAFRLDWNASGSGLFVMD